MKTQKDFLLQAEGSFSHAGFGFSNVDLCIYDLILIIVILHS